MERLAAIPIKTFMVKEVITLGPEDTMADAYEKMQNHHIRHLPVVDAKNRLVGIFTQHDLDRVYSPRETESGWYYDKDELANFLLPHFMAKEPVALTTDDTLKEAADIMVRNKFGCIPIVASKQSKELVGIVSYIDILKVVSGLF